MGAVSATATEATARSKPRFIRSCTPLSRTGRRESASRSPIGCTVRREARISVMFAEMRTSTSCRRRCRVRRFICSGLTAEEAMKTHSMPWVSITSDRSMMLPRSGGPSPLATIDVPVSMNPSVRNPHALGASVRAIRRASWLAPTIRVRNESRSFARSRPMCLCQVRRSNRTNSNARAQASTTHQPERAPMDPWTKVETSMRTSTAMPLAWRIRRNSCAGESRENE